MRNTLNRKKKKALFVPDATLCNKGCIYWRSLNNAEANKACHYFLDTGLLRGCEPSNCDKFNNDRKRRRKTVRNKRDKWTQGAFTWHPLPHSKAVHK